VAGDAVAEDAAVQEAFAEVVHDINEREGETSSEATSFGCDRCGLLWEEIEPWGISRLKVFRGCCPRCRRQGTQR
jgi:hypothetical protein